MLFVHFFLFFCFFLFLQCNLSGFYDPCPEEEKLLKIRYLFRDAVHEVTYGDKEAVRIPKQCEKLITLLCCISLCVGVLFEEKSIVMTCFVVIFYQWKKEKKKKTGLRDVHNSLFRSM